MIKVILVDDHRIVRQGLRLLLDRAEGVQVIAEADSGEEVLELSRRHQPDVVIMDLGLPGINGIEATRRLLAGQPHCRVIALSMNSDRQFVVEALMAGAKGYLLKDCAADELAAAIRSVSAAQGCYLSPALTAAIIQDYLPRLPRVHGDELSRISGREQEVLALIADGGNTNEIAFSMELSIKTVETHRQQIMKKLNLSSIAQLTKFAIRTGLSPLDS